MQYMETSKQKTKAAPPPHDEESFEKLYLESLKREHEIKEGAILPGKIIKVGPEFVTVDIGYKSEGQLPLSEFTDAKGGVHVNVGDTIDVFFEGIEDEEGMVILSKEKADKLKIWEEIAEA